MQKTAYEMRISDWSSDVCSSDLRQGRAGAEDVAQPRALARFRLRTGQPQREQAGGVVVEGFPFDIGTAKPVFALLRRAPRDGAQPAQLRIAGAVLDQQHQPQAVVEADLAADDEVDRPEERRVGKEGVRTCRSWWLP